MRERIRVTGFLPDRQVADILSSVDACVFPFRDGINPKHATFLAAVEQGTFTVTTSPGGRGYDAEQNVFYAPVGDSHAIGQAVLRFARSKATSRFDWPSWQGVVSAHEALYASLD